MTNPTRRSVLRGSLALATAGSLVRPFIAKAAAKTATVWWVQGFAHEEDIAFRKIVADRGQKLHRPERDLTVPRSRRRHREALDKSESG